LQKAINFAILLLATKLKLLKNTSFRHLCFEFARSKPHFELPVTMRVLKKIKDKKIEEAIRPNTFESRKE